MADNDLDTLPGMKESELVAMGNCAVCGKPQLGGSHPPLFYVVTIRRVGFLKAPIQRRVGLEMMLGHSALAQHMGPNEDLAKVLDGPHTVFVHETCAGMITHLLELIPDASTKEGKTDE